MLKYLAAAACVLWVGGPASAQEGAKKEAPKTIVLDVSKLPPEAVEKLLKLIAGEKKPGADAGVKKPGADGVKKPGADGAVKKPEKAAGATSLAHAVIQQEKAGKTVVKAERVGDEFVLELIEKGMPVTVKTPVVKAPEGGKKKPGTDGGKKKPVK